VVDTVMPTAPPARWAPPPPSPTSSPPVPAAESWATVACQYRMKKPCTFIPVGAEKSFPGLSTDTYAYFLAARTLSALAANSAVRSTPLAAPKRDQTITTHTLHPDHLLVKRDRTELTKTPMQLRDDLNKPFISTPCTATILFVQIL
jgi:hypothetical protein